MEDQELEPLEKAIQTAHSNFFVEEESFILDCGWLDMFGEIIGTLGTIAPNGWDCIRESPS